MAGGFQEQFALAFGGGVRFGGQELGVQVGDPFAVVRLSGQGARRRLRRAGCSS
jgi:hypothetical protein